MVSNFFQRIPRKYAKDVRVEPDDAVDAMIFEEVGIKTGEPIINPDVLRSDQDTGRSRLCGPAGIAGLNDVSIVGLAAHRVDIQFYCVSKKTSEGFEDTALKVVVVLLVEYFQQIVDADGNSNHFLGVAPEVGGEPVVF